MVQLQWVNGYTQWPANCSYAFRVVAAYGILLPLHVGFLDNLVECFG
jgi:hypothetical protein